MTIGISERLQRLLDERQKQTDALQSIDDKLSEVARILGWNIVEPKKRGRPPKAMSVSASTPATNGAAVTLADHLEAVIQREGRPLSIGDLIAGVKAGSYKSKAKDIRPVVSLSLIKDERFKRVGRGVYGLK